MNTKDFFYVTSYGAVDGKTDNNRQLDYPASHCQKCRFVQDISFSFSSSSLFLIRDKAPLKRVTLCGSRILFSARFIHRWQTLELFGSPWKSISLIALTTCRGGIRVSRINSSGERIVEVGTRDLSMPWLPGIGCVRLRVALECDEIKSEIFRVWECRLFRFFDNELFRTIMLRLEIFLLLSPLNNVFLNILSNVITSIRETLEIRL